MMENRINDQLMAAKENMRRAQKTQAMLHEAQLELERQKKKHRKLKHSLAEEKADVDKLEGLSLTSLFYKVLGRKEWHLEKERQEYLAALLKFDECEQAIGTTGQDVQRLQNEWSLVSEAENEFNAILKEKEAFLLEHKDQRSEELLAISEALADLNSDRKELIEAVNAGRTALEYLDEVHTILKSASNWGTFDMLGGGVLTTAIKHNKMDAAKRKAGHAQRALKRFQAELADAGQRLKVTIEMDGFSRFADYFFDNLIVDWMVQSKISKATSSCLDTQSKVKKAIETCEERIGAVIEEQENVSKKRLEYIENG